MCMQTLPPSWPLSTPIDTCPLVLQKLHTVIAEVGAVVDASYERWSEVGWELSAEALHAVCSEASSSV